MGSVLWRLAGDNWGIVLMSPGLFLSAVIFGWLAGWSVIRLVYNQRLAHQTDMIANLRAVLEEKLPASFLPPPPTKRTKRMTLGLILIFAGGSTALVGAFLISFEGSAIKTKTAMAENPKEATARTNPPQANNAPAFFNGIDKDTQRKLMLENRGKLELAARDAAGTPIRVEIGGQSGIEVLRVKDGETEYQIQVGVSGSTGAFIFPASNSSKALYISRDADHGKPIDIRQLRYSKGSGNFQIGEHAFAVLPDGKMLQLILVGVQCYREGDDIDELRFKYKIHPADEFLFDSL